MLCRLHPEPMVVRAARLPCGRDGIHHHEDSIARDSTTMENPNDIRGADVAYAKPRNVCARSWVANMRRVLATGTWTSGLVGFSLLVASTVGCKGRSAGGRRDGSVGGTALGGNAGAGHRGPG